MPELNGILCIDKPAGFTSFDVIAKMRGIAGMKKIGHAGTLDPMATGVLPLFFGRATKASDILPNQDKRYLARMRLGITTDTQDITGTTLAEKPVNVPEKEVLLACKSFLGDISQIPPMYSAVKIGGQKLYDLARKGKEIERPARPVTIQSLSCIPAPDEQDTYILDVACSKGTYIRTLVHDIGQMLGCGAALSGLRRTKSCGFTLEQCITLEEAQALSREGTLSEAVLPTEYAFQALPRLTLDEKQTRLFLNGVRLIRDRVGCPDGAGQLAVYSQGGAFLGIAQAREQDIKLIKLFMLGVQD